MIRRVSAAGVAVAALRLLASCSGDESDAATDATIESEPTTVESTATSETTPTSSSTTSSTVPTTTSSSTTTAVPGPDDGEAFDEYIANRIEQFYELRDRATASPSADPLETYPELADFAAGPQLAAVVDLAKDLHSKNWAYREPAEPSVGTATDDEHRTSGVQTRSGSTITVFNCEVDDDDIVNLSTGEIEIEGTLTVLGVLTLTDDGTGWKVTDSEVTQKIEGVAGCYLASEAEFPY